MRHSALTALRAAWTAFLESQITGYPTLFLLNVLRQQAFP
jgi:hypothetical protein